MNKAPLAIVILAAGKSTRMKSSLPKVMHGLAGLPMINWLLKTAEELNPDKIIVVTGPDMDELKNAALPHTCVVQTERNGTAGAVMTALPALKDFTGHVLVLLGDAPLITRDTLERLIAARGSHGASILGCVTQSNKGYGRLLKTPEGLLDRIVEEKDATEEERAVTLVNTGAFCLDGTRLGGWLGKVDKNNAQNELYITQIPSIINQEGGSVAIAVTHDLSEIQGCNTRADLAGLEKTVQTRLRIRLLEDGVTMIDPDTVYLHHDTSIANDVIIEPQVVFGPGVTIQSGTHIKSFSYIEETSIAENVSIGPFARLRPGTTISRDARIGNFVEIKKSSIGVGSKINHLAYVGDCTMGEHVNFSAGAITVNYDGFEKHRTVIEDHVMVGSNVNLVAPVTIGSQAFLAAGSTITKNIPEDALGISREKQTVHKGWAAKYREKKQN